MTIIDREAYPRIAPFALFMVFIGLEEGLRFFSGAGLVIISPQYYYYLYPIKILSVSLVMSLTLPRCAEINLRILVKAGTTTLSILIGCIVFILWINMNWHFGTFGNPQGFEPGIITNDLVRFPLIFFRLAGAVIVVPIMEEIFWRSFLIRYLIDPNFTRVPIGQFTWSSFVISSVLFGLEHNLFLAGMMAGVAYNLLLYYSRSLSKCIIAHAVSNLALCIYVLLTGKWFFW
ncbi:MAG TPA: CAAX prenyl protease-related protein [Nitrospirota bacterium]|nr:CAAX prenyl protease-related protein [Nitrospirota bacterium]